jgi:hypothetical protein
MKSFLFFSLFLVLSTGFAKEPEREVSGFLSKTGKDYARQKLADLNVTKIPSEFLQEAISASYQAEYLYLKEYQRSRANRDVQFIFSWTTPVFTCKNGSLDTIEDRQVIGRKMYENPKGPQNTFRLRSDGIFELRGSDQCFASGDMKDGIVKTQSGKCVHLKAGNNVFLYGYPFYSFPEVANACCKKDKCGQTVHDELLKFVKERAANEDGKIKPEVFLK